MEEFLTLPAFQAEIYKTEQVPLAFFGVMFVVEPSAKTTQFSKVFEQ